MQDNGNEELVFVIVLMALFIGICILNGFQTPSIDNIEECEVKVVSTPAIIDDATGSQAVYVLDVQERNEKNTAAEYNGAKGSRKCCFGVLCDFPSDGGCGGRGYIGCGF